MGEPGVEAFAISAVAIQIERGRGAEYFAFAYQADWYLAAIGGSGPQALADIVVGIERPKHRGLLEHHLRACSQFQLTHLRRAIERFIAQANGGAVEFQAVLYIQAVGGVR